MVVVAAERLSARCRVGGRVSEQAGEGKLLGGRSDRQTTQGFEDAVAWDSLPGPHACSHWVWFPGQVPLTGQALVTPMWGDEDREYRTFFGSIMGERVPKREGLNPGHCPLLRFTIFFIRTYQRLSSLKKVSLHCGLEGSLKSTSFWSSALVPQLSRPLVMPPPWPHGSLPPFSPHSESPCAQNHIPPPVSLCPTPAILFFPKLSP